MIKKYTITLAALLVSGMLVHSARAESLSPGDQAPDARVHTAQGEPVQLRSVLERGPSVVIFYRGGWCPYCTKHLAALAGVEEKLKERGFQILALSPDRPEKIRDAQKDAVFQYELLSDSSMEAAKAFGLAFTLDEDTLAQLDSYGIDIEDASGETHHMLPVPAVFIVDQDGTIRFAHADPNYKQRLDPDQIIREAHKIKKQRN